jgi:hypothetical protein
MKQTTKLFVSVLILATAAWVSVAMASQGLDRWEMARGIVDARAANQPALKAYSWTQRTEVKIDGDVKVLRTEILRYTSDGQLQRSPMGDQPQQQGGRGVRGRKKASKQQEMKDWAGELTGVVAAYGLPTPGKVLDFTTTSTLSESGETLQAQATDVVVAGDRVSVWYDRETLLVRRMQVQTSLAGDALEFESTYRVLDGGVSAAESLVVRVPSKSVDLKVENFNHMRQ